jgi:ATP-binding cassette, subfamily B, bacterial
VSMGHQGWMVLRSMHRESPVGRGKLPPGTVRRILGYARPYKKDIAAFLVIVVIDAALVAATPLLLKRIVDEGVLQGNRQLVVNLALLVGLIALFDAGLSLAQRWFSSRIGEGLIYHLRTEVFDHVQRQPVAFFTRTQTGALVSRLNNDVIGAQQAFTSTLSNVVSNVISVAVVGVTMFVLSWQITLVALVLLPMFLVPAKIYGRRLQQLARDQMELNADMSTTMTERFNVAGALLVKLFGHYNNESAVFADRAGRVRDIGVRIAMSNMVFITALMLVASLATAFVYGLGGVLAIGGTLTVGTLLALTALLGRLYGPLTALSNVRIDVMTALVSFDRVFEVLDLEPLVADAPDAQPLRKDASATVEFQHVTFRYPSPDEVSLASLESVATQDRSGGQTVLHNVSFRADPGSLVALVGPSGAGKSTITHLVTRLYDPTDGVVRLGGRDIRTVTQESLRNMIGVVTQDAHLFHDTIRANLLYAQPEATDDDLIEVLKAAQVWDLVGSLPDGLDTVVGDRGYRLSGGEKQRIAIARLLLKQPRIVILDEATAHLDSESEVAVQRALDNALIGRTSLVVAHRLSTIRGADLILVVDEGRIVERGTHEQLLARSGLYADLYRTQFAPQADVRDSVAS